MLRHYRAAYSASHVWSGLAVAFLDQFPNRTWEFFRKVLKVGAREWSVLLDLNMDMRQVLTKLLRKDPETAWDCIADVFRESGEANNGSSRFLVGDFRLSTREFLGKIQGKC